MPVWMYSVWMPVWMPLHLKDASPLESIALDMVGTQEVKIITVTKLIPLELSLEITRDYY